MSLSQTRVWTILVVSLLLTGCLDENSEPVTPGVKAAGVADEPFEDCVTGLTDDFGTIGPYPVESREIAHPSNLPMSVRVYSSAGTPKPAPVVFFSHAFNVFQPDRYAPLLERLASRGNIVVFSPYSSVNPLLTDHAASYDQLWDGFTAAVSAFENEMDLSRIGFIGHSFGGGATPAMAWRASVQNGWGENALSLFIMAPWRVLEMDATTFAQLPTDIRVLIHVYANDSTNDHRFAIDDIWNHLGHVSDAHKDYVLVESASQGDCSLAADHGVPIISGGRYGKLDAYDLWAVWRRADALTRCTFEADAAACDVALGRGSPAQAYMGRWTESGADVTPQLSLIPPEPRNCAEGETCTYRREPQ